MANTSVRMIGSAPWKLDPNRISTANGAAGTPLYESHAKVFVSLQVRDESPACAMAIANAVSARLSDVAPEVAATACCPARNKVSS